MARFDYYHRVSRGGWGAFMKLRSVFLPHVAFFAAVGAIPSHAVAQTGAYSWSGPYVGAQGGGGWGHSGQSDSGLPPSPPPPPGPVTGPLDVGSGSFGVSGGTVGGTAGYNWQTGPWVLGVEGDYSWANITGSSATCGFAPPHGCGAALESFGTLRGRFGYAMGYRGTWLPYVTGGLAVGELHAWDALTPASGSAFRAGWTIGAGIETVLAPNWTFKFEYLYISGQRTFSTSYLASLKRSVSETISSV